MKPLLVVLILILCVGLWAAPVAAYGYSITAHETSPEHFSFVGVAPQAAFKGGRTPQQHVNPVAYVYCNGTLAATVGPWDKTSKVGTDWNTVAEEPAGGYLLPVGDCTASFYYWTFDGKTPVPNFIASTDFGVT